ncbi:hypothetical protein [Streptomyces sp. CA-106131]
MGEHVLGDRDDFGFGLAELGFGLATGAAECFAFATGRDEPCEGAGPA